MQYKTKTHTKYTQINANKSTHSEMTKPNPENCKNCSSKFGKGQKNCDIAGDEDNSAFLR